MTTTTGAPMTTSLNAEIVDLLQRSQNRIRDPQQWCQQSLEAYDDHEHAVAWCAIGSVYEESGFIGIEPTDEAIELGALGRRALDLIAHQMGYNDIAALNDLADHETVMRAFDAAIAQAKSDVAGGGMS